MPYEKITLLVNVPVDTIKNWDQEAMEELKKQQQIKLILQELKKDESKLEKLDKSKFDDVIRIMKVLDDMLFEDIAEIADMTPKEVERIILKSFF